MWESSDVVFYYYCFPCILSDHVFQNDHQVMKVWWRIQSQLLTTKSASMCLFYHSHHSFSRIPCSLWGMWSNKGICWLIYLCICSRSMLFQCQGHEKKRKLNRWGWLLIARTIDTSLTQKLQNQFCNGIHMSVNSAVNEPRGKNDETFTYSVHFAWKVKIHPILGSNEVISFLFSVNIRLSKYWTMVW